MYPLKQKITQNEKAVIIYSLCHVPNMYDFFPAEYKSQHKFDIAVNEGLEKKHCKSAMKVLWLLGHINAIW